MCGLFQHVVDELSILLYMFSSQHFFWNYYIISIIIPVIVKGAMKIAADFSIFNPTFPSFISVLDSPVYCDWKIY